MRDLRPVLSDGVRLTDAIGISVLTRLLDRDLVDELFGMRIVRRNGRACCPRVWSCTTRWPCVCSSVTATRK